MKQRPRDPEPVAHRKDQTVGIPTLYAIQESIDACAKRLRPYAHNRELTELVEILDGAAKYLSRWVNTEPVKPIPPLLCVPCLVEIHNGHRTGDPNAAHFVINGATACHEHFRIVDGPVMPDRTPGGILLPGQPLNGG